MRAPSPAFCLRNVTLGYGGHPAVHHLDGDVLWGSLTAIIGPNGSGKSTLLKGLAGLIQPLAGDIVRHGFSPQKMAYMPQSSTLQLDVPARVSDLVTLGLWPKRGLFQSFSRADEQSVHDALAAVGLQGFASREINTLSGGQLQRALFARVLMQDARVILLDEPFTAVDARTVADLVRLTKTWSAEGRTVLVVLHDDELVQRHFPQSILLAREAVAWGSTEDVLKQRNLERALVMQEAWDENAPWCETEQDRHHDHSHNHGHDHEHRH